MEYYLPKAIVLLEYIGTPINMLAHLYYESGPIPMRVPQIIINDLMYEVGYTYKLNDI